ncbi:carbohydrate ABC transporter permease [Paenibacillus apiarius]|uniref:Carbohydrate ABC transporter permease n=1 Tax=Paenibacillus apiarius TaxID=46240 RepID=A0ABT4DRP3_9BACL|nr:carbohydrate ABC transporter permease [Paenibacillus apiarius]MBN3524489.1 carbohydrate ABC transporter permease [Paenibacillus apiarius]MCY9515279.1 carbohydrate ABC transporter permease [Paenibacillus apiarius]MCY9520028.1 carbohydrate ABC transporter permease [Paenibacillus apiarius]MCY9554349.1 carbohydrate ABC transporter permease [Paenibacillus apiarius]MCY9558140.1 carbohydrate ABC transporter permease [Paenibacillus apiarius]
MAAVVKETRADKIFIVCNYIYLLLAFVIVAYPLLYIISASISDPKLVNSGEMWLLPKGITFDGYLRVFENAKIWSGYKNTIIYTVVGTAVNLFVTLPAAYALSRKDFIGRGFFMAMFMFTMFFGGGLVPGYLLIKNLGLINSMWALILPGAASVWNIIVARTFFQSTIPKELQEAAHIDGCTNMRLFIKIVLPLSAPIIAVMALFYGVGHWNSYFGALIYLNEEAKYPLQMILRQILVLQEMSAETTGAAVNASVAAALNNKADVASLVKYAVIIVSTLPVIAVYPFLQRYFVQGVMIGSVKG